MDFISPIINLILPVIKKYWKVFFAALILASLIFTIAVMQKRILTLKEIAITQTNNTNNLLKKASKTTQVVNITRRQLNENLELKSKIDSLAKELKIKPKRINSITFVEVEKQVSEKSKIDTILLENKTVALESKFQSSCYDLSVKMFPDSGFAKLEGIINPSHTTVNELVRIKGWFWKGLHGKKKWEVRSTVLFDCDSVIFNKNLTINIGN